MKELPFSSAFKGGTTGESRHFLKTAAGAFAKKGYHRTTVDEIAGALGVAKGTIYYHFKSKEELYLAVIHEGVYLLEEQMRLSISVAKTPAEKIKKIIGCMLSFIEDENDFVFLFIKELCGTEIQRAVQARMLCGSIRIIHSIMEEGLKNGSFKNVNPEITARSLYGMVVISALHYLSYAETIPHDQVITAIEKVFLEGTLAADYREEL